MLPTTETETRARAATWQLLHAWGGHYGGCVVLRLKRAQAEDERRTGGKARRRGIKEAGMIDRTRRQGRR